MRFVSLADLIATHTNILDQPSRESRLVLGLKLTSSVLQLGTTKWLNEVWEAKDILFPEVSQVPGHRHNILSRPFVHRSFSNSGTIPTRSQQPTNVERAVTRCNDSLYSLGIIILEIWHWQTFSSLYNSSAHSLPVLEFSYHLSERLFEEAGYEYAMAVRRCIRGFEMQGTNLGDDSFRRKVYQDVLGLLEGALRSFSGCDNIQDIIGEEWMVWAMCSRSLWRDEWCGGTTNVSYCPWSRIRGSITKYIHIHLNNSIISDSSPSS